MSKATPSVSGKLLLVAWRIALGWNETRASKAMDVARQTYSLWERGGKVPSMQRWFEIHRITKGAVPWWSWCDDPAFVALVRRLAIVKKIITRPARPVRRRVTPPLVPTPEASGTNTAQQVEAS